MNDKSRNIHTPCGRYAYDNLSKDKFLKDYYKIVKPYLNDDFSSKVSLVSSVDELKSKAEKEFNNYYGSYPTCAVFAPGSLTVAGKNTNLVESKSLSMAVQLVTLIVGTRSHGNKWCNVKTLSDEIAGCRVSDIRLNDESLDLSAEITPWLRYVKGTILSFKARRESIF
nr:PREDICTED: uncharacterized protein LOC100882745 [Megachile rotundata]